jgi:DinB superfamily
MERFVGRDLSDAEFRACGFHRTRFVGVEMFDVTVEGEVQNLVVNGVEVGEYVEAELDRRHPERPLLRASEPAELREGWVRLQEAWGRTIARIRSLPDDRVRAGVDGEWSALQTLRHLVFATDSWLRRGVLDREDPFWAAGLGWGDMPPRLVEALDDDADPDLAEVLEVRAGPPR